MNRKKLKENAKKRLEGNYSQAIVILLGATLLPTGISQVIVEIAELLKFSQEIVTTLNIVTTLIVEGFIMFGYHSFFLKLSRGKKVTYNEILSKTNMFWPYIAITLLMGLFIGLWSLLFVIPGIIASISYSQSLYIALDNPELNAQEVLKESKRLMDGHKMEYFILQLSFLGWEILTIFTFGLLSFWLIPYQQVTMANFYDEINKTKK